MYTGQERLSCRNVVHNECRRATSCRQSPRFQSCEAKKVCETTGPVDNELSKMHEAEVHVFSDSVLCLGNQAMNMPDTKAAVEIEWEKLEKLPAWQLDKVKSKRSFWKHKERKRKSTLLH